MLNLDLILQVTSNTSKKVIGLMKCKLGGKIVAKFVGLRAKT